MKLKGRSSNEKLFSKALPLSKCIAKTVYSVQGVTEPGLTVEEHCRIVGMVARELVSRFPAGIREKIFPEGSELVAAVHDVGKINPHFQAKIYQASGIDPITVPELQGAKSELEKNYGSHAGISQAALDGTGKYIPMIAGKHHGFSPQITPLKNDEKIGGTEWQNVREELIVRLQEYFQTGWPQICDDISANAIAGLTTISDWIGSGGVFQSFSGELRTDDIHSLIKSAVDRAGFLPVEVISAKPFSDIFPGYEPRPFQNSLINMVNGPGTYIVEAPMGSGKTEAALFAAYKLISSGMATGIYFALPTRLTSEKIYERMNTFLNRILTSESIHRNLLIHGESWLYETELGEDGRPGYSWFSSAKRALLAPFAVGTIDQALMAVMNVKHGFVRSFGLVGKVVILDEIHSYDSYTGLILEKLIQSLRQLGATVVLLSATLTSNRRMELVPELENAHGPEISSYPLLTHVDEDNAVNVRAFPTTSRIEVQVSLTSNEHSAIEVALEKASEGQYVLWIENTVGEAQTVFKHLAALSEEAGVTTGLLHSRFSQKTRKKIEAEWVNIYGKNRNAQVSDAGKILVGTQVLEQSLDIDADFLITKLAPTDMIIQRAGRLWRHEQNNPYRVQGAKPELLVITPESDVLNTNLLYAFGASGIVYSPYVLARSMEVISTAQLIAIPSGIRDLIEKTYMERDDERNFLEAYNKLQQDKEKLRRFALLSVASKGRTLSESAATRYSDIVYCDVLLLKQEVIGESGLLRFTDDSELRLSADTRTDLQNRKSVIRTLHKHMITMPEYLAPEALSHQELAWLKPYIWISEDRQERIRVGILELNGKVRGWNQAPANAKYDIKYNDTFGYSAVKKDG